MNIIKTGNMIVGIIVGIMTIYAIYVIIQNGREKREIVRICPDGTRIYKYSDGRFIAVDMGWGGRTEMVPNPEICDK